MKKSFLLPALACFSSALFAGDVIHVSAQKLYADYEQNGVFAEKRYGGKTVFVTGTIDNIGKDLFGNSFVRLHGNEVFGVQCNIAQSDLGRLEKVRKKMVVEIKGTAKGRFGNVVLTDCTFAK